MRSRRGVVLALLVPLPLSLAAQSVPRPDDPGALVRRHVTVLAADSLEGRGAGYRGPSSGQRSSGVPSVLVASLPST